MGVVASGVAVATGATPIRVATSTTPSLRIWDAIALNALLLLLFGTTALVTTRRWFRQGPPTAQLRRQRRLVRRRALLLGVMVCVAHQTLVVLLDPRFALDWLTGRRRVFGPIVTLPDRLELAWAATAVALGYIVLAWLLWRSTGVPDSVATAVRLETSVRTHDVQAASMLPLGRDAVETLPRNPATGRVVRQFDL